MDYKILKVRLDLTKDNRLPVKPVQGESAVKIEFTLIHNSQPFPLTGTTVNVKFRKKDGTISLLPGVITNATAGIAEVKLTNQVLLFAGTVVGIVEVLGDAGVAKSFIFTMEVQPGVDDPNTESADEYPALDQAFLDIQSIRNDFDAIVAGLTVDSEVILARGGKTTLKERLDGSDAQLADIEKSSLRDLKSSLGNYLEQYTGIVFIGDSITWGLSLPENPANYNTGRDGTLSDIRDVFASGSYVNNLKRYIGERYFKGVAPILTNHQYSPQGESIATYQKEVKLYPYGGDFNFSQSGAIAYHASRAMGEALMGWQIANTIESGSNGEVVISFNFTGEEFALSFSSINETSMNYELFVDGVSQGIFTTAPDGTIISGFDQRRVHTFPYVENKLIEIKSRKNAYVGYQALNIEGIIINKKVKISNQGIIGTTAKYYKDRCMTGNVNGDGVALSANDRFVFIQLGTNDRIIDANYPKGANEFKRNLQTLLNEVSINTKPVLMIANPVSTSNENPSIFSFSQSEARDVVIATAKQNSVSFIDNYSIFSDLTTDAYTADGVHPNTLGHERISDNIIKAIEAQ